MPVPSPGRRELKKLQARESIEKAAVKLFTEKGFNVTTVAEIMHEAKLGTGTFYNYFNSKEDLIGSVIGDKISDAKKAIEVLVREPLTAPEKVTRILLTAGKIFEEYRPLIVVVFQLSRTGWPLTAPVNQGDVFKDILLEVVKEGQKNGELNPNVPSGVILELLHGMLESAVFSPDSAMILTENLSYKLLLLLQGLRYREDD